MDGWQYLVIVFQTDGTWMVCFDCCRSNRVSGSHSASSCPSSFSLHSICLIKSHNKFGHSSGPAWLDLQNSNRPPDISVIIQKKRQVTDRIIPYNEKDLGLLYLQCEIEIEQGLTSHQTHYRSYRGRYLQVIWPNQQSTEGNQLVLKTRPESHQDRCTMLE